jgi:3-deoxy-D-manno-octulosonate 8-phosphate phosphatase (KDO 8-P phosphatase)
MGLKQTIKAKLQNVKVIVTDVDGVLTDSYLFIDEQEQEPFAKFSIYDGMGIVIAHDCGIKIIVISGRKSLCTEIRCKKLGIDEVYTGIGNKKEKLLEIAKRLELDLSQVVYLGDDLIDLGAMSIVGVTVAPRNAVKPIRERVDHVTKTRGGEGVLRELVELILKAQGRYDDYVELYLR